MKYLVKDNKIVQSGIPGKFTRENGEEFWGGYQNRTDLHYEDGWRDEEVPDYDPAVERLSEPYYDQGNDVVTYDVIPLDLNLDTEKKNKIRQAKQQANSLLSSTDWYVTRKYERGIDIPADVETEREAIVNLCNAIETEIIALTTIKEVMNYVIDYD